MDKLTVVLMSNKRLNKIEQPSIPILYKWAFLWASPNFFFYVMYLTESPVVFRMILASHFGLRTAPPWNLWLNWAWYDSGYTKNHAVPTMMMCRSKKPQLISTTITVIILFLTTFWLVLRLRVSTSSLKSL